MRSSVSRYLDKNEQIEVAVEETSREGGSIGL